MRQCITHFHACDCRERKFEEHERALRTIQTWAFHCLRFADRYNVLETVQLIKDKCDEVLEEKK